MLSFLLISALINNSFADDHHSPYYHEKELHHDEYDNQNVWMVSPKIVICENMTDFTVSQVKYSIGALKKSSMTKSVERRSSCDYSHEFGIIKIVDGKHVPSSLWGKTKYIYNDGYSNSGKEIIILKSAVVQLDRNVTDITLLIHELGHAYGLVHYDSEPDIMNTNHDFWYSYSYKYEY